MRIWSLHPRHLDPKGLVALWRETLLAQKVLKGRTKGYKNHPQLNRFKAHPEPVAAIAAYLWAVCEEADARGYHFDRSKVGRKRSNKKIAVSRGQVAYEFEWLCRKLKNRHPVKYRENRKLKKPALHPLFRAVPGPVADWERDRVFRSKRAE